MPHRRPPRSRSQPAPSVGRKIFSYQGVANDHREHPRGRRQILTMADRRVPLIYQTNKRARRVTLEEGRRFALLNRGWIRDRLDLLPEPVPFRSGRSIPFLGVMHRIRHQPQARGVVWQENGEIQVAGRAEHLSRRVEDWLRREARREIERRAHAKAELIGKRIAAITIRDPKSRWGSCSPRGQLSFSWRLILAPRQILDYVVAHEVAHLKELNHGPRFWKLTAELTRDADGARAWLNDHGPMLHRYGLEPV